MHGPALVPDLGAVYILPRLVGLARARRWLLTSAAVDTEEALAAGLIAGMAPPGGLAELASMVAATLTRGAPLALAGCKELLRAGLEQDLPANLALEADLQTLMRQTEDHREGIAAFRAKRPPEFQGRVPPVAVDEHASVQRAGGV